jgi:hypothetical protein
MITDFRSKPVRITFGQIKAARTDRRRRLGWFVKVWMARRPLQRLRLVQVKSGRYSLTNAGRDIAGLAAKFAQPILELKEAHKI